MYLRLKCYRRALGLEKVLKATVSKRSAMLAVEIMTYSVNDCIVTLKMKVLLQ